mmetsp:Transcript_27365/g.55988  ORF Transcript_27365/g.55988 Transcript_27365/m.55988 type:complete len:231 (-) Transcript_27365:2255-2947(-)
MLIVFHGPVKCIHHYCLYQIKYIISVIDFTLSLMLFSGKSLLKSHSTSQKICLPHYAVSVTSLVFFAALSAGVFGLSLSPFSNLSAVICNSAMANLLLLFIIPLLRDHTFCTSAVDRSLISCRDRFETSISAAPPASCSLRRLCASLTRSLVVSTVFSSSSFTATTGLVRNSPRGSTTAPRTVRPEGRVPLLSLRLDHTDFVLADMILASCSMKIAWRGVSSSVANRSNI